MKRTRFAIILLSLLLILASCSSVKETDITEVNEDGSPIWITEVPQSNKYVYGVGSAKLSNEKNSRDSADAAARADLSRRLQSTIKEATTIYTIDAEGSTLQAYESITMQTVQMTIQGVKVEQRYTAPDGTVWSLVSLEAKKVDGLYKLAANDYMNQLEEKKINIEAKKAAAIADFAAQLEEAEKALAEATETLDEAAIAVATAARDAKQAEADQTIAALTEYAAGLTAEVDSEMSAIDVDGLAKAVADELVRLGYTE